MDQPTRPTIGILGGMSSASTADYYRLINQKVNDHLGGHHHPELLVLSVDFGIVEGFVRSGDWEQGGEFLAAKAQQLERAGASCIFLATNTMHKVRPAIESAISIPFIDIFEVVAHVIQSKGMKKVGILGTYPVMSDPFFVEVFAKLGIELVPPSEESKREINRTIFEELTHQRLLPSSKAFFMDEIQRLKDHGAEGVILGCTEIKLLVNQDDTPNIPLFDTTELHCEVAARMAWSPIE